MSEILDLATTLWIIGSGLVGMCLGIEIGKRLERRKGKRLERRRGQKEPEGHLWV